MLTSLRLSVLLVSIASLGCVEQSVVGELPASHPANPQAVAVSYQPPPNVLALTSGEGTAAPTAASDSHEHEHGKSAADDGDKHADKAPADDDKHEKHEEHGEATLQGATDKLVGDYLKLSDQLANDKAEGAAELVEAIHDSAHALIGVGDDKVKEIAKKISKAAHEEADTLKQARDVFKAMSPAVIELTTAVPPSSEVGPVIREAYCPMAKASWLQMAEKVTNPYFGSEMLRCGKVTRTIETKGGDGKHEHHEEHEKK